jgi:hypothetical protein
VKIIIRYRDTGTSTKMTLSEFPCSVGRAPTSQIVLPHESVSGNHAVIEKRDGVYLIRDLESRNGLISDGARLPSVVLNPHTIISVGNIDIEVVDMTTALNDQTKSMMAPPRSNVPTMGWPLVALSVLPMLTLLKTYYLSNAAIGFGMGGVAFVIFLIFAFSAFSAWMSSFFDANYKFKKAFARILWIIALFTCINSVFTWASAYFVFNLDNSDVWTAIRTVTSAISTCAFLYFYCKEVFFLGQRRTLGVAGTSVVSLFSLSVFLATIVFTSNTHLSGVITPPLRSFTRENRSLADFDAKMKQSFDKIEKERVKAYEKAQATEAESGK